MNKADRKEIAGMVERLEEIQGELSSMADDILDRADRMSDYFYDSPAFERLENENVELSEVADEIQELIDRINAVAQGEI